MKSIDQPPIPPISLKRDELTTLQATLSDLKQLLDDGDLKRCEEISLALTQSYPLIAETWAFLALTLQRMELQEQALKPLKRAYDLLPNHPDFIVRYATGLARNGELAQAEKLYIRAIELEPYTIHAYYNLCIIKILEADHPYISTIKAISIDPEQNTKDRVSAFFALGKYYSDHQQYEQAFAAYSAGSQLKIEGIKPKKYVLAASFYANFNQRFYAHFRNKPAKQEAIPTILICGLPRSGKSLLERLVSVHSNITAGDELAYFQSMVSKKMKLRTDNSHVKLMRDLCSISQDELFQPYEDRLRVLSEHKHGANRIIDTSPGSLSLLAFLPLLNPHIPVVLCRRNPVDLAVSIFFKLFSRDKHLYSYDIRMLGNTIAACECLMDFYEKHLPNPIISVQYEDMVNNPLSTTRNVWNFLKLEDIDQQMLNLEKYLSQSKKVSIHSAHTMIGHHQIQTDLIGVGEYYRPYLQAFFEAYDETKQKWDGTLLQA